MFDLVFHHEDDGGDGRYHITTGTDDACTCGAPHGIERRGRGIPANDPQLGFKPPEAFCGAAKSELARMAATTTEPELLVLSVPGIRYAVPEHYRSGDEFYLFSSALTAARHQLATGHARAFVAIRIAAEVIGGIGHGTDRELARFEVYADRVVLVPTDQGGLSDAQKAKALALPKKRLV